MDVLWICLVTVFYYIYNNTISAVGDNFTKTSLVGLAFYIQPCADFAPYLENSIIPRNGLPLADFAPTFDFLNWLFGPFCL